MQHARSIVAVEQAPDPSRLAPEIDAIRRFASGDWSARTQAIAAYEALSHLDDLPELAPYLVFMAEVISPTRGSLERRMQARTKLLEHVGSGL